MEKIKGAIFLKTIIKRALFIFILLLGNRMHSQQPDGTIYFGNGKATLDGGSKATLKKLADNVKKSKSAQLMVSGFTDAHGSTGSNLALSKKRALAVSDYFTAAGIEKNKITVQFFGEEKPLAKNEKHLRDNRRVEIRITADKKESGKDLFGIYGKLWTVPLKHIFSASKIRSNEDLIVSSPGGTTIWIPANSLCRPNGELARGDIDIELSWYYKNSEMLLANLHTASDSAMLETYGIINVVARCGGERLSLKKGSEMNVEFLVPGKEKDLAVFTGSQPGNKMNWEPKPEQGTAAGEKQGSTVRPRGNSSYQGFAKKVSQITNLVLSSDRLGWISCGRLSRIETKTSLSVEIDPMYHAVVRLVFKGRNAIMPGYSDASGSFKVINIPVGQKATLVAFGMVKETPYFISKDLVIGNNQVEKLVPRQTTFEALRMILKKVD